MGQKTVRFSDLSGQLIMQDDAVARVVIHEHPDLDEGPVEIETLVDEAKAIEHAAQRIAIVELYFPGDDEPRRVAMDADEFSALATDRPMDELLAGARPARRPARTAASGTARDRTDYATLKRAGKPHRGKITDAEKRIVLEHFDDVNDRLLGQGLRTISLSDPEHVERYGLEPLAKERVPDEG